MLMSRIVDIVVVLGAMAGLLLSGCSSGSTEPDPDTRTADGPASNSAPAALNATDVLTGLTSPWGLVVLDDGGLLVSERDTRKILHAEGGQTRPVRTIDAAQPAGEGGLLGLAITDDERTVFAYYTSATDNRIVSMSWDGQTLGEPSVILDGIPKAGTHNGGRMVVGPDGHLYVGTGDARDSQLAQDTSSLGGKILRLTPEGAPAPDNPFDNEVYSFGHRNVQGLTFDDEGRLWACEFGSQHWDELNLIEPGANYGWPLVEGSGSGDGMINPKVVWETSEASPSGLAYWDGSLWMAALRGATLWQIPVSETTTSEPIAHFEGEHGRLRSVVVAQDGQSLLLTTSNTDGRSRLRDGDDRLLRLTR
jgi:glucose/arabinose dehydrogenase